MIAPVLTWWWEIPQAVLNFEVGQLQVVQVTDVWVEWGEGPSRTAPTLVGKNLGLVLFGFVRVPAEHVGGGHIWDLCWGAFQVRPTQVCSLNNYLITAFRHFGVLEFSLCISSWIRKPEWSSNKWKITTKAKLVRIPGLGQVCDHQVVWMLLLERLISEYDWAWCTLCLADPNVTIARAFHHDDICALWHGSPWRFHHFKYVVWLLLECFLNSNLTRP